MTDTYQIQNPNRALVHYPLHPWLLRDGDELPSELMMQARVRSGDYFMTLATELDQCAQALDSSDKAAAELERIVAELLLVHKNFEIKKKKS